MKTTRASAALLLLLFESSASAQATGDDFAQTIRHDFPIFHCPNFGEICAAFRLTAETLMSHVIGR
jgi:hypothetical protein